MKCLHTTCTRTINVRVFDQTAKPMNATIKELTPQNFVLSDFLGKVSISIDVTEIDFTPILNEKVILRGRGIIELHYLFPGYAEIMSCPLSQQKILLYV